MIEKTEIFEVLKPKLTKKFGNQLLFAAVEQTTTYDD